jgi:hypothetical protein
MGAPVHIWGVQVHCGVSYREGGVCTDPAPLLGVHSREVRNVSSELRNVSSELRNVTSELRNVSSELRHVSSELRHVTFRRLTLRRSISRGVCEPEGLSAARDISGAVFVAWSA